MRWGGNGGGDSLGPKVQRGIFFHPAPGIAAETGAKGGVAAQAADCLAPAGHIARQGRQPILAIGDDIGLPGRAGGDDSLAPPSLLKSWSRRPESRFP